jgi:hypothetical protein
MAYTTNTSETYDDPEVLALIDDMPQVDDYEEAVDQTYTVDLYGEDNTITNTADIEAYVIVVVENLRNDLTESLKEAFAAAVEDGARSVYLNTQHQTFEFTLEYTQANLETFNAEMESWREYYIEEKAELAQRKLQPNYGKIKLIEQEIDECDRQIKELSKRKTALRKQIP